MHTRNRPFPLTPPARIAAALALAAAAWCAPSASACPSCYGDASGPVIEGMNLAVVVMVGITGGVFSWIVAFALRVARRERPANGGDGLTPDGRGGETR